MNTDLIPVFLGADLNCYNFARAFHEAYGVESYALRPVRHGTPPSIPRSSTSTIVPDIDNEPTMLKVLPRLRPRSTPARSSTSSAAPTTTRAMIIRRKAELPEYIAPGPRPPTSTV